MRINQFVAAASGLSRRAADAAIAAGRVTIADRPAQLGEKATPDAVIQLDDQVLKLELAHTYVILHKPVGYVSSRAQQGQAPTLYQLLPNEFNNLRIAGRLDQDSSGLILLSDDGDFVHRYTHPSFGKAKIYELTLARILTAADRFQLETGVKLTDGLSQVKVLAVTGRNVKVSLTEGRNRQLRRTFGALGYTIERLHRTQMGAYRLDNLASGTWKEVTSL